MKISREMLKDIINEEFHRLFEGNSYINTENINISSGRQLYDNGYLIDVVDHGKVEVEMRRDPSQTPAEYSGMKNYGPTAQPEIIRMDEPITDETIVNRKMFSDEFVENRTKNEYPRLYEFFDGLRENQKETLEVSVFLVFDSEHLGVTADLYITDGSVVREPVDFSSLMFIIREDKSGERIRDKVREKYSSVTQQYEKYPTVLEFPNGDHGEAAEYVDNNTNIKVVWVSDFSPSLILLPAQSESKIITELRNSGFEYNIEYE